jgi:L-lactate utilization protein LutC
MSAREEILARVRRALADVPKDESAEVTRGYLREHGSLTEAETIDLLAENLADYRAHVHRSSEAELPATIARLLTEHGSTSVALPHALPEAWLTELGPEITRVPDPLPAAGLTQPPAENARVPDALPATGLTQLPAENARVPDAPPAAGLTQPPAENARVPDALPEARLAQPSTENARVPDALPATGIAQLPAENARVVDTSDLTPRRLDEVDSVISACALAVAETGTIILDGGSGQGRRLLTLVPDHHICVIRVPDQVVASVPQALEGVDPTRPQTWIAGPSATSDIELDRVEGVHGPRTLDVILVSAA